MTGNGGAVFICVCAGFNVLAPGKRSQTRSRFSLNAIIYFTRQYATMFSLYLPDVNGGADGVGSVPSSPSNYFQTGLDGIQIQAGPFTFPKMLLIVSSAPAIRRRGL